MIIIAASQVVFVGKAMDEDIVDSLDVERLFDFGVGSDEKMEEDESGR